LSSHLVIFFLIDAQELTLNVKNPTFDPFCHSPHISPSDIPPDFPREYRDQLQSLLPHLPAPAIVSQLASSHRDSAGQLVYDAPVLNRPWEWIENLGEPASLDPKDEDKEREEKERLGMQYLVKNSGSLSLDVFGARLTGDGILQAQEGDARIQANVRTFQDGLSAEGMFKRDWRETRMEPEIATLIDASMGRVRTEANQLGAAGSIQSIQGRPEKRAINRASPASSVLSRSSAHGSSRRPSPGQSSLNRQSVSTIDTDSSTTGSSSRKTGSKRKATASDDEVIAVEASTRGKRPKPKAVSAKTRAKKR
jgi:mediator of RNA polymerase II transcription subunit 12